MNWDEPVTKDVIVRNRGDLAMGIEEIALMEDGLEGNFFLTYDFAEVTCEDGAAAARSASSKDVAPDSGKPDTGWLYEDTGDTAEATISRVLPAGCELPIHITMDPTSLGDVFAAVRIVTTEDPASSGGTPSFFRDPDERFDVVILEGTALKDEGKIYANPRSLDFGFVWAGEAELRYVSVHNEGQGDLTLGAYEFTGTCQELFDVTWGYKDGLVLEPGHSTVLEVAYTPLLASDVDETECDLKIYSDDPNEDEIDIRLRANLSGHPEDSPPTLQLIRPAPGHIVNKAYLEVEFDAFDANQPATSLGCKIRSAVLAKTAYDVDCEPTDKSGHMTVQIPVDELEPGVDTVTVQINDQFGQAVTASTTILYLADFPDNDADGDGYASINFDGEDCDDNDINTYPEAAEIADGKDNDCDAAIDEGTTLFDDDGDTFTEEMGDCDDRDDETFPGAGEVPDNKDNDCDGIIDETTSNYDDDGDGFNEVNGDCRDDDPEIHPAAIEYCDGIDNDCDSFTDQADGCIATDSEPIIVGGIRMEKTDLVVGESVTLGVLGFDADEDFLTYAWTEDSALANADHRAIDNSAGAIVTFTAPPSVPNDQAEYTYELQVEIQDDNGNKDWVFGEITVHSEPIDMSRTEGAERGTCANSSNAAILPVLPLVFLAWAGRRRREQILS